MTAHDGALIEALAYHIRLTREVMCGDLETVAAAEGMDLADVVEAVGWFRTVAEPAYRGTPVMKDASALATRLRHGPLFKAKAERPDLVSGAGEGRKDARPGANGVDHSDPTRPPRPCARCRRTFQPTLKRRILCAWCFRDEDNGAGRGYLTRRDAEMIGVHGAPGESW